MFAEAMKPTVLTVFIVPPTVTKAPIEEMFPTIPTDPTVVTADKVPVPMTAKLTCIGVTAVPSSVPAELTPTTLWIFFVTASSDNEYAATDSPTPDVTEIKLVAIFYLI
jgi:hypothetical protein